MRSSPPSTPNWTPRENKPCEGGLFSWSSEGGRNEFGQRGCRPPFDVVRPDALDDDYQRCIEIRKRRGSDTTNVRRRCWRSAGQTLDALDAVLLICGDFSRQRCAGVEAEMCDGGEGGVLDIRPEIKLADDPAFVTSVTDPSDGGAGRILEPEVWRRRRSCSSGVRLAGSGRASFSFAIRRCVISGWSIMQRGRVAHW